MKILSLKKTQALSFNVPIPKKGWGFYTCICKMLKLFEPKGISLFEQNYDPTE